MRVARASRRCVGAVGDRRRGCWRSQATRRRAHQPAKPAPAQSAAPAGAQSPAPAAEAAKHRAWLNKYCVGCHNSRTASPAEEPVNLESASLDNLLPHAATWERVLRKLSVRAMPPQGMPHPTEAEYAALHQLARRVARSRLGGAEHAGPLRDASPEPHRIRAMRFAICWRSTSTSRSWLPSDGANFGFDNIAASLRTSPLLLERYLTAAQRISAHGRWRSRCAARAPRSIRSAASSARADTSTACRSGHAAARWSAMCFPPTPNTSSRAGWSGAWRKATPASRATTCRTRSSSPSTARRCIPRRSAARRITRSRPGT